LSIFSTGPNGEGSINSTLCDVTTANEVHPSQSSIYNCSTRSTRFRECQSNFRESDFAIGHRILWYYRTA